MNLEKFAYNVLIVLVLFLFSALILQDTSRVSFFLINKNDHILTSNKDLIKVDSCETVYLQESTFLTYNQMTFETAFQKILGLKHAKVSDLYSPLYKSNLTFKINDDNSKKVELDLEGDLILVSECDSALVDSLIKQNLEFYYPNSQKIIKLNGNTQNYLDALNI